MDLGTSAEDSDINLDASIDSIGNAMDSRFSTIQGVLQEVHLLACTTPPTRGAQILQQVTSLISFIDRYALAIDSMTQFNPNPCALIWGCLRMILKVSRQGDLSSAPGHRYLRSSENIFCFQVSQSAISYSDEVLRKVDLFGRQLLLYNRYEIYFEKSADFRKALAETYWDTLEFLYKAKGALLNVGTSC